MLPIRSLPLMLLLSATAAQAGHIYGTLRQGGQFLGAGERIIITCGNQPAVNGQTRSGGSYRVRVPTSGRCSFAVEHDGRRWITSIHSYDDPTQYNFDLVREGDRYVLRRR